MCLCKCSSEPCEIPDSSKEHVNARILHIISISTDLRFFHPFLVVVFMIANTVQSFSCRLRCCQMKNVVYPANFSFSLVLKMDYVIELIAKDIWGRLAPIRSDSH